LISGPNGVINHSFVLYSIDITIKDPWDVQEIFKEMAGIAMEISQMIGSDSSPDVWGLVDGIDSYNAIMSPYDDKIYVSDHYHPYAYGNDVYLIPGKDIYNCYDYTIINHSVVIT